MASRGRNNEIAGASHGAQWVCEQTPCSLTPHSNQIKTEHRSGHQPGTVLVPDYIELDAVVKFEVT